jgi:hypothetical protein
MRKLVALIINYFIDCNRLDKWGIEDFFFAVKFYG